MDLLRELAQIRELTDELNPSEFVSRYREWKRGGLPSTSIPAGTSGGTGGDALPLADRFDRWLYERMRLYENAIARAKTEMGIALRVQTSMIVRAERLPDPIDYGCENPACGLALEGNLTKGECQRCRQHRHRHGMAYPKKPEPAA